MLLSMSMSRDINKTMTKGPKKGGGEKKQINKLIITSAGWPTGLKIRSYIAHSAKMR